jgi:hypothetical protein
MNLLLTCKKPKTMTQALESNEDTTSKANDQRIFLFLHWVCNQPWPEPDQFYGTVQWQEEVLRNFKNCLKFPLNQAIERNPDFGDHVHHVLLSASTWKPAPCRWFQVRHSMAAYMLAWAALKCCEDCILAVLFLSSQINFQVLALTEQGAEVLLCVFLTFLAMFQDPHCPAVPVGACLGLNTVLVSNCWDEFRAVAISVLTNIVLAEVWCPARRYRKHQRRVSFN